MVLFLGHQSELALEFRLDFLQHLDRLRVEEEILSKVMENVTVFTVFTCQLGHFLSE